MMTTETSIDWDEMYRVASARLHTLSQRISTAGDYHDTKLQVKLSQEWLKLYAYREFLLDLQTYGIETILCDRQREE